MDDRTVQQLVTELEAKETALQEKLTEVRQALAGLALALKHTRSSTSSSSRASGVAAAVETAVAEIEEDTFNLHAIIPTVERLVGSHVDAHVVSRALSRMRERNEIVQVAGKSGKRAALYRRPDKRPPPLAMVG